jgi:hypothetical protein
MYLKGPNVDMVDCTGREFAIEKIFAKSSLLLVLSLH